MVSGAGGVGVEMHAPHLPHLKSHAGPGRSPNLVPGLHSLGLHPGPAAAGSQRDWPLAVMRSSSGPGAPGWPDGLCNSNPHPPPRVMQLGAGGACGKAEAGVRRWGCLKVLPAHLARWGALASLPPGFVLPAVSIPPVTPRASPDR